MSVIFDTDMDTDCDDAGALAMLHALADRGEVRILATVVSSKYPYSAPCVEAINRYCGRGDLLIGVPKGEGASTSRGSRYAREIAAEFPTTLKTGDAAPSAAAVYRKILAAEPDGSVVVVTVGYLTNLRDLLRTQPDDTSPFSGRELARRKVKLWVCMGGRYPQDLRPGASGNFKPDPKAAVEAVRDWPGPICFSGDGEGILTGRRLRKVAPPDHPVRRVYDLYLGDRPARPSWDQVALLHAVRPEAPYWDVTTAGQNHVFPDGTNEWRPEPDDPRQKVVAIRTEAREEVQATIERLMAQVPSARAFDALTGARSPLQKGDVIAFFGDSVTMQGDGEKGYIGLLRRAISTAAATEGLGVRLVGHGLNGGRVPTVLGGKSPWGDLGGSMEELLAKDQPAVTVIFLGINDVWHGEKGTPKEEFEAGIRAMLELVARAKAIPVIATPPGIGERPHGKNSLDEKLDDYCDVLRAVAREKGVALSDLRAAFGEAIATGKKDDSDRGLLTYDGVHMIDAGNELIARELAKAIAEALRGR